MFFQYLDGNNNESSVSAFFFALANELNRLDPNWQESHVLVLDNCSSHKTSVTRQVLHHLGFRVLFSAPASYLVMPVEKYFAKMKS